MAEEGSSNKRIKQEKDEKQKAIDHVIDIAECKWKTFDPEEKQERIQNLINVINNDDWKSMDKDERAAIVSRTSMDKRSLLPGYNYTLTITEEDCMQDLNLRDLLEGAMSRELFKKSINNKTGETVYSDDFLTYEDVIENNYGLFKTMWEDVKNDGYHQSLFNAFKSGGVKDFQIERAIFCCAPKNTKEKKN